MAAFTSCESTPDATQHSVHLALALISGHDSNPTLSYTQRLEERIKELEEQMNSVLNSRSSTSTTGSSHSSPSVVNSHDSNPQRRSSVYENGVARNFKGLKVDEKGDITYHGATSFFHLPGDRDSLAVESNVQPPEELDGSRRERLVSNAWEQRALENLTDIPVSLQTSQWGN